MRPQPPGWAPPSLDELNAAFFGGYHLGMAVCPDGTVYTYRPGTAPITKAAWESAEYAAKAQSIGKGLSERDILEDILNRLRDQFGFDWKRL